MTDAPVVVVLDNRTLMFGKLNLGQVKKYRDILFAKVADIPRRDPIQFTFDVVPIIGDSLRVYHPEVTDEWLMEHLDLTNVYDVFHKVFDANGLRLMPVGELTPTAESAAPSATTSMTSTAD